MVVRPPQRSQGSRYEDQGALCTIIIAQVVRLPNEKLDLLHISHRIAALSRQPDENPPRDPVKLLQWSGSQFPWNPKGTRRGNLMVATGGAEMSSASMTTRSLVSLAWS
jgi:hypothetical protein